MIEFQRLLGLNRPQRRNAINDAPGPSLSLGRAPRPGRSQALVVFRHSRSFSAGLDLTQHPSDRARWITGASIPWTEGGSLANAKVFTCCPARLKF